MKQFDTQGRPARAERQARIFVVDDDPASRQILAFFLDEACYEVTEFDSGEAFLAGLELPPDLVLLDVAMPGMDGYQVCERLKKDPSTRDIPVIFVTAAADELSESRGLSLGAADYLTKPINPGITHLRIRNQLALRQSRENLDRFFALSLDHFCIADVQGRFLRLNPSWEKLLGCPLRQLEGRHFLDFVHEDDLAAAELVLERLGRGEKVMDFANRYRRADRSFCWLEWQFVPSGRFVYAAARDVTGRKQAEDRLRLAARVFDTTLNGVLITEVDGTIVDVNNAFTSVTGYTRDEVLGKTPSLLKSGRHDTAFYRAIWQAMDTDGQWAGEIWNRRKNGEVYPEWLHVSVITDETGAATHRVGIFSDITLFKQHEIELERIAHHDALTGIPNRLLLSDRMRQAVAQARRETRRLAVCYLDLDGFKPINDALGHDAGDRVLVEIAQRISHSIRANDTVARLGGDEFVVLLSGVERGNDCTTILDKLLAAISRPVSVEGRTFIVTASIGVTLYPDDRAEPDVLLRHADQAMYIAKQMGKNRYYFFDAF
jgi:diguanylate cyclase (GGDEF)-like protein/PAS domain S-box-containing protein